MPPAGLPHDNAADLKCKKCDACEPKAGMQVLGVVVRCILGPGLRDPRRLGSYGLQRGKAHSAAQPVIVDLVWALTPDPSPSVCCFFQCACCTFPT